MGDGGSDTAQLALWARADDDTGSGDRAVALWREALMPKRGRVAISPDELEQWRAQCSGKSQYGRGEARVIARVLQAEHGGYFSAYRCSWCGAFHAGHTPRTEAIRKGWYT